MKDMNFTAASANGATARLIISGSLLSVARPESVPDMIASEKKNIEVAIRKLDPTGEITWTTDA